MSFAESTLGHSITETACFAHSPEMPSLQDSPAEQLLKTIDARILLFEAEQNDPKLPIIERYHGIAVGDKELLAAINDGDASY